MGASIKQRLENCSASLPADLAKLAAGNSKMHGNATFMTVGLHRAVRQSVRHAVFRRRPLMPEPKAGTLVTPAWDSAYTMAETACLGRACHNTKHDPTQCSPAKTSVRVTTYVSGCWAPDLLNNAFVSIHTATERCLLQWRRSATNTAEALRGAARRGALWLALLGDARRSRVASRGPAA